MAYFPKQRRERLIFFYNLRAREVFLCSWQVLGTVAAVPSNSSVGFCTCRQPANTYTEISYYESFKLMHLR